VREWLVGGRDEDLDAAVDLLATAARVPPGGRGSPRLEALLCDFRVADSEDDLLRVLQASRAPRAEERLALPRARAAPLHRRVAPASRRCRA
jgi:hypothetical protein